MLKQAILHKQDLNNIFPSLVDNPRYKYYTPWPTWNLSIDIKEENNSVLQYVSVNNGQQVLGFMSATVSYPTRSIENLGLISFCSKRKLNAVFMGDFHEFIMRIFTYFGYNKICWSVCCGSPHEKTYDKLCKKYNGKIVGTFRNDTMLCDGTIHDEKWYEILKSDFLLAIENNKRAIKIKEKI